MTIAVAIRRVRDSSRPTQWMALAVAACLAAAALSILALWTRGESVGAAFRATAPAHSSYLLQGSNTSDSWSIMLAAYERRKAHPEASLYAPFFEGALKFQYPPSSLLVLDLLTPYTGSSGQTGAADEPPTIQGPLRVVTGLSSQLTTLALIALSVLLFELSVRRFAGTATGSWRETAFRCALGFAVGCCFYPVMKGHALGQVQVYLNGLAALCLLAALRGREALAGAALGLCCLIKPQFGVVWLWAAVRGRWRFASGFLLVAGAGFVLALLRYGWQDHVDYLSVLTQIGSHGEAYWPNQSVNGVLHRFLSNGDALAFDQHAYAPSNDLVNLATALSSAGLLLLALWPGRRRRADDRWNYLDLLIVIVAATMAAPVAWEHHYGVLLPIFAAGTPLLLGGTLLSPAARVAFLLAFVATGSIVVRPQIVFANRWIGLLGSHVFIGAVVLLALMVMARQAASRISLYGGEGTWTAGAASGARVRA